MIRVYDKAAIMRVLSHPSIWPYIADNTKPEDFTPPDNCIYLTETGDEIYCLTPSGKIHANCLPNVRGKKAISTGRSALRWLFDNTGREVIKANIPIKYPLVIRFAKKCGMKEIYRDEEVYFIAEREEWAL